MSVRMYLREPLNGTVTAFNGKQSAETCVNYELIRKHTVGICTLEHPLHLQAPAWSGERVSRRLLTLVGTLGAVQREVH